MTYLHGFLFVVVSGPEHCQLKSHVQALYIFSHIDQSESVKLVRLILIVRCERCD